MLCFRGWAYDLSNVGPVTTLISASGPPSELHEGPDEQKDQRDDNDPHHDRHRQRISVALDADVLVHRAGSRDRIGFDGLTVAGDSADLSGHLDRLWRIGQVGGEP